MTEVFDSEKRSASWYQKIARGRGWNLEVTSAVVSTLCMLAIVIVLAELQDTRLAAWTLAVQPNTVISVLSTAAKAFFIFPITESLGQLKWLHLTDQKDGLDDIQAYDNASRGPVGALKFFWAAKAASIVSYVSCIVTILALGFEPFSQQLLGFQQRETRSPVVQSSVPCSTTYDFFNEGLGGASMGVVAQRDALLAASVFNGLYGVVQPPPFVCPGTTCDYPDFTTMGVCNQCKDVTATSTKRQMGNKNDTRNELWEIVTPGNLKIYATSSYNSRLGFQHTIVNTTITGVMLPFTAGILKLPNDVGTFQFNGQGKYLEQMQVFECAVTLCARTLSNYTMTNGTLNQGTQNTTELFLLEPPKGSEPAPRKELQTWTGVNATDPSRNMTFVLNDNDNRNIYGYVRTALNVGDNGWSGFQSALAAAESIPRAMDKIAAGMSHRMMSGPNATLLHGDVYNVETYITVEWGWVSLPLALTVFACGSLVVVMLMTRQARQIKWKTSLTPLLLTEDACPLLDASGKPEWTSISREIRTRTIAKHLPE